MVPLTFLLSVNLLDLYDLFLNFAGNLFGFAFRLQLGIIGEFSGHFLDITLCFVKRVFPVFASTGMLFDSRFIDPVSLAIVVSMQFGLIIPSQQRPFCVFR